MREIIFLKGNNENECRSLSKNKHSEWKTPLKNKLYKIKQILLSETEQKCKKLYFSLRPAYKEKAFQHPLSDSFCTSDRAQTSKPPSTYILLNFSLFISSHNLLLSHNLCHRNSFHFLAYLRIISAVEKYGKMQNYIFLNFVSNFFIFFVKSIVILVRIW